MEQWYFYQISKQVTGIDGTSDANSELNMTVDPDLYPWMRLEVLASHPNSLPCIPAWYPSLWLRLLPVAWPALCVWVGRGVAGRGSRLAIQVAHMSVRTSTYMVRYIVLKPPSLHWEKPEVMSHLLIFNHLATAGSSPYFTTATAGKAGSQSVLSLMWPHIPPHTAWTAEIKDEDVAFILMDTLIK